MTAQPVTGASFAAESPARIAPRGVTALLATDESESARAGEEWIRRLRWARTPAVDVLTIAPRPGWASGFGLQTYRTAVQEAVIQAREMELVEAQRIANSVGSRLQHAGIRVRVWARTGEAADEIVQASRQEAMDLVVIGGSGRRSRAMLWGRSVSSQVARESDVPVLVAQAPSPGTDALPRSIAVLDADDRSATGALAWLRGVGWLSGAHLTLARPAGRDGRAPGATLRPGTEAGDPAGVAARVVELPSERDRLYDGLRGLIERAAIDLAVIPGANDRADRELALRIAEVARVSVLLIPATNPPR